MKGNVSRLRLFYNVVRLSSGDHGLVQHGLLRRRVPGSYSSGEQTTMGKHHFFSSKHPCPRQSEEKLKQTFGIQNVK